MCSWQMGNGSLLQTQEKATGGLVTREEGCGGQQRACNTPNKGLEYSERTYQHSYQRSGSVCASETQELSPNQQLAHLMVGKASGAGQLLGHCAGLKPFALSLILEAEPGPFTFPSIHSSNHFPHF